MKTVMLYPRKILYFLLIPFLLFTKFLVAFDESSYRYIKTLKAERFQENRIVSVVLDDEIYGNTTNDFRDVRVVDQNGVEQPYILEREVIDQQHLRKKECQSEVLSLAKLPDNRLQIIVRITAKDCKPDRLTFFSPLIDFEKFVTIAGGPDGNRWNSIVENQPIFDYDRYMNFKNLEVRFPPRNYRYFKVDIHNITDIKSSPFMEISRERKGGFLDKESGTMSIERREFRIEKLVFHQDVIEKRVKESRSVPFAVKIVGQKLNDKEKTTEILLETVRQPLTKFILETSSTNFNRLISVEQKRPQAAGKKWESIAKGSISKLDLQNIHRNHLGIVFPERRQGHYRLVIQNQDNPPLTIENVQAKGNSYRLLFVGYPDKQFRVFYGSEQSEKPTYDLAGIFPDIQKNNKILSLELSLAQPNSNYNKRGFGIHLLNNKYFLTIAVILMVLVLIWGIFQAIKRAELASEE